VRVIRVVKIFGYMVRAWTQGYGYGSVRDARYAAQYDTAAYPGTAYTVRAVAGKDMQKYKWYRHDNS
jgi:hypothetical protein